MRVSGSYDSDTHSVTIAFESNCYTDGLPLVDRAIFYNADFELSSPAFALAAALLVRRHCGEVLEVVGPGLSIDMVEALRWLLPQVRSIAPTDGFRRHMFTPGVELACSEMTDTQLAPISTLPSAVQLTSVFWSGDFPQSVGRSNPAHRGRIFTNAALIAESSLVVSIAVGLLSAGTRLGRLHVPAADAGHDTEPIVAALRAVGVQLNLLRQTSQA